MNDLELEHPDFYEDEGCTCHKMKRRIGDPPHLCQYCQNEEAKGEARAMDMEDREIPYEQEPPSFWDK